MQIAQRVLLIISFFAVLLFGIITFNQKKEEKLQNQWEVIQTELFLNKICRRMSISEEEYFKFNTSLNYSDVVSKIEIEEYRREEDMKGNSYYFVVSWNELQKLLAEEGNCQFNEESVIRITVENTTRNIKNVYYGIVSEGE